MTTTNGWPGKPGVPMNPERKGWHWVRCIENNRPFPLEWTNDWNGGRDFCWAIMGSEEPEDVAKNTCYLGPVLTPDEVANREDVKWHEGYVVGVLDVRRLRRRFRPRTRPHYDALQKRVAELEEAVRTAAECIDADDTIAARGFLSDVLIKKHEPKWVCPNNTPGCLKNCGNYGCGN